MTSGPAVHIRRRFVAVTLAAVVILAGCSGDDSASTAPVDVEVDAGSTPAAGAEAAAVAKVEGRTAVDVRTPEEYAEGHVEGAERLGLADADFASRIAALDRDGRYVVYCRSGNRSAKAAAQMVAAGLDVYDGGALTDMVAAGWPTA